MDDNTLANKIMQDIKKDTVDSNVSQKDLEKIFNYQFATQKRIRDNIFKIIPEVSDEVLEKLIKYICEEKEESYDEGMYNGWNGALNDIFD